MGPLRAALHGTFRCAALNDEQSEEDQELLRVILKVLLGHTCKTRGPGELKQDVPRKRKAP